MPEKGNTFEPGNIRFKGMLKKAASGVPWLCRNGLPGIVALLPDLRAHRLAALRGVRAHVLGVRSARQNGCGLAGRTLR